MVRVRFEGEYTGAVREVRVRTVQGAFFDVQKVMARLSGVRNWCGGSCGERKQHSTPVLLVVMHTMGIIAKATI